MTTHTTDPAPPADAPAPPGPRMTKRDARWVLRRCSRRGHVFAHLTDPQLAGLVVAGPRGDLLRCLRCGTWVDHTDPTTPTGQVVGTPEAPVELTAVPQVLRGSHGRKLALLRVLAVERAGRGLLLLAVALGIARLANSHVAVADWFGQLATAAKPLADQLGWNIQRSHTMTEIRHLLGYSASTYTTAAWLIGGYGVLQFVEGFGLWGGWRWAEYLAAIATSLFVPLEVYELIHHPTALKSAALTVNVLAVGYLVYKGRLFGLRGGHHAYLAEVREATLLADELRRLKRPTAALSADSMV